MFKRLSLAACLTASVAVAQETPGAPAADPGANAADVCRHFVNRARFKQRGDQAEFVVTLADGCLSAQLSAARGEPAERIAAAAFLSRLAEFRDVIIDMNMTRIFGSAYSPLDRIKGDLAGAGTPTGVSVTGEYLIAHRMGLISAMSKWLDTAPAVSMALRREH